MSRVKITAMLMATIIAITPITASATAIPLPYVPPTEVHILDMLHNAFGLTIPAIEDETKRLGAYYDLYKRVLGASYDNFYTDIQNMIRNAQTSRQIELGAGLNSSLQTVLKSAVQNGYKYVEGDGEPMTPPTDLVSLKQWYKSNGYENIDSIVNTLYNYSQGNQSLSKIYGIIRQSNVTQGEQTAILIMARARENATFSLQVSGNSTFVLQKVGDQTYYEAFCWYVIRYNFDTKTYTQISNAQTRAGFAVCDGVAYNNTATQIWSNDTGETTASITAQSQGIIDALINGVDLILTAHSQVVDGSVDDTKPIVIDLPITLPVPAISVPDLPAVQDDLGVLPLPLTEDAAATVADMQETRAADLGDTSDYAMDLTRFFPFCLPFDIARIIGAFVAEPEAPAFSYTIENPFSSNPEDDITLTIDLSAFDAVASVLRTLESIVFVVGLCAVTRSLYLRG